MRYRTLSNAPLQRSFVTYPYAWCDGWFKEEELNRIVAYCKTVGTQPGEVVEGVNESIRVTDVSHHGINPQNDWIFERLNKAILDFNNRWWGFDLNGYETFQYGEYIAEQQSRYDWHTDLLLGAEAVRPEMIETRKLSLSLLLSEPGVDFEGGEFQFNQECEDVPLVPEFKKGRMVAFPSWMIHRVTPVTKGVRRSLVVWVTGPKFR